MTFSDRRYSKSQDWHFISRKYNSILMILPLTICFSFKFYLRLLNFQWTESMANLKQLQLSDKLYKNCRPRSLPNNSCFHCFYLFPHVCLFHFFFSLFLKIRLKLFQWLSSRQEEKKRIYCFLITPIEHVKTISKLFFSLQQ